MLILKSLHIISMVAWFAGLFYLPRLYVYHSMAEDKISRERFKIMERKLFYGIMIPSSLVTVVSGIWLWTGWGFYGGWLHAKVFLVVLLIGYQVWCWRLLVDFSEDKNKHTHVWYRWFNEIPVIFLILIVFLVELKPF